jgi:NADH:ubiquinone oxidoreductase subunit K
VAITHVYYLASGLWLLGLAGVLLRRDPWGRLAALLVMLAGAALVLAGAARTWGAPEIHGFLALLLALAGSYAVVLAAVQREGT